MAIDAIQPITNFSMILPASSIAPAEVVTIASDLVTTPASSTIVTLGESQPATQPLFDSSGNLVSPGVEAQTPQSQALANELTAALNAASTNVDNNVNISVNIDTSVTLGTTLGTGDLAALALEMNLLDAAGLSGAGLLNSSSATDFSGILGANIDLAIAGIATGGGGIAATGTLNPNANALNVAATNAVLTAPTATTTTLTTPAAVAAPAIAPTVTAPPATAPAAVAPTVTAPVATAPVATAPAATVPAATVPTATAPPAIATPTVTTTPAATPTGLTPADVLQQLVADVNGRALANLVDPGFASTSAGLFVSAAIFRAANNTTITTIGTADIAGIPPGEVTAMQPARTV